MLDLETPIVFNKNICKANIDPDMNIYDSPTRYVELPGYGPTFEGDIFSNLSYIKVFFMIKQPIISHEICKESFTKNNKPPLPDYCFCTSATTDKYISGIDEGGMSRFSFFIYLYSDLLFCSFS